jgi:hypothetical protein
MPAKVTINRAATASFAGVGGEGSPLDAAVSIALAWSFAKEMSRQCFHLGKFLP